MNLVLLRKTGICLAVAFAMLSMTCHSPRQVTTSKTAQQESVIQKNIDTVLNAHDEQLMSIPGVVGVFVGLLPDNKTSCLKVMVVKETEDLKERIPKSLEGYPVVIEESGVIRPLD